MARHVSEGHAAGHGGMQLNRRGTMASETTWLTTEQQGLYGLLQ